MNLHRLSWWGGLGVVIIVGGYVTYHRYISVQPDGAVEYAETTRLAAEGTTDMLPVGVGACVANFYAAYHQRDWDRIVTLFTTDTTADDRLMRERISTTKEWVERYQIVDVYHGKDAWTVTISEERHDSNNALVPVTTLLTVVTAADAQGGFLLSGYSSPGFTSKYGAFLLQ